MDDNYRIGRVATLFIYLLEGIITIAISIGTHRFQTAVIVDFVIAWLAGFLFLFLIRIKNKKMTYIYWGSELLLTTLMSAWITLVFQNPHLIFLMMFLQWMCNMVFLKRRITRSLCAIHIIMLTHFVFYFQILSTVEFFCAIVVLLCAMWFADKIAEMQKKQLDLNQEQTQSLDDMLELVEVKFEEANDANAAKSAFLANMSHEIRTPINTVLGLDTMILRECKDEQISQYAKNIHSAGQSLLTIINDILDLSKIESGHMEIIPVEYELANLINDITNMISPKAEAKNLDLIINVDETLPCRLVGDDVRIRQVLINLLTNAVKYTHEGMVILTLEMQQSENNEVFIRCLVQDTGIGIKEEDLEKLFAEFVRIEEKRNRNIEGTGLGINIVTRLLDLMGSRLEVESVYGVGSTFGFTIKQKIANKEAIGNYEDRIAQSEVVTETDMGVCYPDARILVVDDNAMNRMVFKGLVKKLECQVDEADSGMRCLQLVQEKEYDIIFMDHMMPEMDGIETFQKMKELPVNPNANTPVVALTANAVAGAKESYLEAGFFSYLSKPINPEQLEKMIGELLPESTKKETEVAQKPKIVKEINVIETDLPDVEGVDWDYAMLKLQEQSLVKDVVKDFSTMAVGDLQELQRFYQQILDTKGAIELEEAFRQYRVKVHAMKTSVAMFGGLNTSAIARVLEFAARDRNLERITSIMPVFEECWLKLKKCVDEAFGFESIVIQTLKNEDAIGETLDSNMLKQYLEILAKAMEELDVDTADATVETLLEYTFSEEEKKYLEELSLAVRNLDTEVALNIIEHWIGGVAL